MSPFRLLLRINLARTHPLPEVKMKRIFISLLITPFLAGLALGQKDYHKVEFAGGYTLTQVDGIVGDGDMFTDDPNDPLGTTLDINTAFGNPFDTANFFPATPVQFTGKHHKARMNGFVGSVAYNFSRHFGIIGEFSGAFRSNKVQGGTTALAVVCQLPGCNATTVPPPAGSYRGLIVYPGFVSDTSQKFWTFMGGLQYKDNSTVKKWKPFARALAGVSAESVKFKDFTMGTDTFDPNGRPQRIYGTNKLTNNGFTTDFGGGLDMRLTKRLDIRLFQFDYIPVRIKEMPILAFKQAITGINIPNNLTFTNSASPGFTQYSPYDVHVRSRWQNNFRIGFGIVFH